MAKVSTKESKNAYQLAREAANLTREQAAEAMNDIVTEDRIYKIEHDQVKNMRHDEILEMSKCYKSPELCNYFCSSDCAIGHKYVPAVEVKDFSKITLEILGLLTTVEKDKNKLIEIAADSKITPDELPDFLEVKDHLEKISIAVDGLQLWFEKALATGNIKDIPV